MPGPKIVIVDDDISYVIPLQAGLAEEYTNQIEIEIITEIKYLNEFFSAPQKIDLLIVAEKFYSEDLKKHLIKKILLLTENEEGNKETSANTISLFKYSSVREIFNVINSRSTGIRRMEEQDNNTQIIVISSACGGVGKTTISLGLCGALEKDYKKVLYVGAEHLQTFQYWMTEKISIRRNDLFNKKEQGNVYQYLKNEIQTDTITYLPPFKASLLSLGLPFEIYKNFIRDAKEASDYDFIIVDTDSSFDADKADLITLADKVIFVTDLSPKSIFAMEELVKNISEINDKKYLFIGNRYDQKWDTLWNGNPSGKFIVSDYVEDNPDMVGSLKTISEINGIKRIAYLLQ